MLIFWHAIREAAKKRHDKKNQLSFQPKICFSAKEKKTKTEFIQKTKK